MIHTYVSNFARALLLESKTLIKICGHFTVENNILIGKRLFSNRSQVLNCGEKTVVSAVEPFKMKIDSPQFHSLFTPEVNCLVSTFQRHGCELRIAGGAVRDLLMSKQPLDIDFATVATPQQMKDMFNQEGSIRIRNKKGETHGTITVRINDKEDFEVTTLRIDVATDGRHAQVEFTTDWHLDASRRDFTINAMFLGIDGTVYDYFNGIEDLDNRRVRFVGNTVTRIQQDYLRMLRYFRFYGRISQAPDNHDPETLTAISTHASGLKSISGERIWIEFRKLLKGNFKYELLKTILNAGITPYLGLPINSNVNELDAVFERAGDLDLHPITILCALLRNENDMTELHSRLKFSSYERDLGYFILANREDQTGEDLLPYQVLLLDSKKQKDSREWIEQLLSYLGNTKLLAEFKEWKAPKFPVSGHHLLERGISRGHRCNLILAALKKRWIGSNFTLSNEQLFENFDEIEQEADLHLPSTKDVDSNRKTSR